MIENLRICDFGILKNVDLDLAPGKTFFAGSNGSGKSSILEAFLWCLWGKYLRAERGNFNFTRPGTSVEVTINGINYVRLAKKGSTIFTIDGQEGNSDNNKIIDQTFGSMRMYLFSRVFHRSLLNRFSSATDAERKQLLDFLLGSEFYEEAYQNVQMQMENTKTEMHSIELDLQDNRARYESGTLYVNDLLKDVPQKPDDTECQQAKKELAKEVPKILAYPQKESDAYEKARVDHQNAQSKLQNLALEVSRAKTLLKRGVCPMCGSVSDFITNQKAKIEPLELKLKILVSQIEALAATKDQKSQTFNELLAVVQENNQLHRDFVALRGIAEERVRAYKKAYEQYEIRFAQYEDRIVQYRARLSSLRDQVSTCEYQRYFADRRLDSLAQLKTAFGPSGARLLALSNALLTTQRHATQILSTLYHRRMQIEFEIEKKAVKLYVTRDKNKRYPYRGLSIGESSLADFAVLKALARFTKHTGIYKLPVCYDDICNGLDKENEHRLLQYLLDENEAQTFIFSHTKHGKNWNSVFRVRNGVVA